MEVVDDSTCFINELPNELLLLVIQTLYIERGFLPDTVAERERQGGNAVVTRALHALTLTSRRLAVIATPQLYRCILSSKYSVNLLALLLRSLMKQPELARHIQYLEVERQPFAYRKIKASYESGDLALFTQCLNGDEWTIPGINLARPTEDQIHHSRFLGRILNEEQVRKYIKAVTASSLVEDPESYTALIVLLLARNLTMVSCDINSTLLSGLAFRKTFHKDGLQTAVIRDGSAQSIVTIKAKDQDPVSIQDFVRLKSSLFPSSVKEKPALANLDISVIDFKIEVLQGLAKACRGLQRFGCRLKSLDSASPHAPPRAPVWIDFSLWRLVLAEFQDSLIVIELDTIDAGILTDMDRDIPAFGSFKDFVTLKHLSVSGLVLWGDYSMEVQTEPSLTAILPASLEYLKINVEWDDDVEEALHASLPGYKDALPNLTIIDCSWSPAPRPVAEYLQSAYEQLGVKLILQAYDP